MAEHETESNPDEAFVTFQGDCEVKIPELVRKDMRMLRWLHHRVVDLMASHGHANLMILDVEDRLAVISSDLLADAVTDLVREARAAVEEVSRG